MGDTMMFLVLKTFLMLISQDILVVANPVISGLPIDIYVGELESDSRYLYTYSISVTNNNPFTCTNAITSDVGTPTGQEFGIQKNTAANTYELYVKTPTFTQGTGRPTSYFNKITCTDNLGNRGSGQLVKVHVVPGEVVTMNNLEGTGNSVSLSVLSTGSGVTVKTAGGTSRKGHSLTYSMTSSIDPKFFTITPGGGQIKTNYEMKYLSADTPTVLLTVTALDTADQIRVTKILTVNMNNQNTIPSAINLPLAESKLESLPAGTTLMTVGVSDTSTSQTHTFSFTCSPIAGLSIFQMDTGGNFQLIAGKSLDFETTTYYNCSIFIDDGLHKGGPFIYEIKVTNINEAPVFQFEMYQATLIEGKAGSSVVNPGFSCIDPDAGDTVTYQFLNANNSDRFTVTSAGALTFAQDYDVDNTTRPTEVVLTVFCVDSGRIDSSKLIGSSKITITIQDANDNTPTFSVGFTNLTVNQFSNTGSIIGSLTVTDVDSGSNGAVSCSGWSTSPYSSYYTISSSCLVYIASKPDYSYGTVVSYKVLAKDKGNPQLTGSTVVDILYEQNTSLTTPASTTTTTDPYFFSRPENIAMFVILTCIGLTLLALGTCCILHVCCGKGLGVTAKCLKTCDQCLWGKRHRTIDRYPRVLTPDTPPAAPRFYKKYDRVNTTSTIMTSNVYGTKTLEQLRPYPRSSSVPPKLPRFWNHKDHPSLPGAAEPRDSTLRTISSLTPYKFRQ